MRQTDATGQQLGDVFGRTVPAAQQKAADAALRHAQALARAAQQMGDSARGASILRTALVENAGASDRAATSVLTQISSLERGKTLATQFGDSVKGSLLSIVGPAALAGAAIGGVARVVGSFSEAFAFKAQLDATTLAINAQIRGVRDSATVWSEASAFAREFKLTQQETTEAIAASIGVMRASKAPVEDILGVLARMQVLSPEQSLQEAAIALKALASGDTTSLVTRFEVGRDVANQMKAEIQGGADAVAVMSKFLSDTGIGMDVLKTKTEGASGAMKDLALANEELALAQAAFAQGPGLAILQARIEATRGATRLLSGDFDTMGQSIAQAAQQGTASFEGLATAFPAVGEALRFVAAQSQGMAAAQQQAAAATQVASAATQQHTAALTGDADASTGLVNAYIALSTQLTEDAAKSELASVQSQTLAIRKAELTQQAQLAAGALLASGAAGEQAAGRLAASSSLVDQLTAAFYRLRAAQIAATQVDLKALTPAALTKSRDIEIADAVNQKTEARAGALARSKAAAEAARQAELAYQRTLDNYAPSIRRAEDELGRLEAGTAAHYDKLNEIARLKESQQSAASKARRGAAGAAKLSDQAKLNNQLLSQQEQADNRLADAEREHQQRMLDIDKEFAKRQLEQSKANELSKRAGELGFLKSITASELNATKTGRAEIQRINERFYADFAEAQKQAQAGNLKMSEALVEQARHRAEVEQQYAEQIDKARQDKDASEVTRLQALLAKERALLDEQQKQIVSEGDPNVKARELAQAEETAKFQENQDKIGTSADRAADRIVTGAQRAGKAIKDVNIDLAEQDRILNRIGARTGAPSSGAPGAGTPPLTPPSGGVGGVQPGAPIDLAALQAGLDAIRAAIDGMSGAVTGAQRETTGAVRGLSGRLVA